MIEIREVKTKRLLKKFVNFPIKLYKNCPYFTPYIYEEEINNLTPGKNPAQKYCDFKLFLAYKNGKIVGRICAILNHYSNNKYNQKRIRFNRIDMIDDIEVTRALIKAVEGFGQEKGMNEIAGPLGYSDQDKEGLLTFGFEQHNMFVTFYHYPYYYEHLKQLGFIDDATWREYRIRIPESNDIEKLEKIANFVANKFEFHIVRISKKRQLKPYVLQVLSLMNVAYKDLYGYVPISEKEMEYLAAQYVPLLNLDYTVIIADKNEKVIAFGLMIPSPAFALKKSKGKLYPLGWIRFLRALKKGKVLDMLLVAVEPELQNTGVMSMIFAESIRSANRNGIKYAETGPELLDNTKVQSLWKNLDHEHHKTRVCMVKKIEEN
ncbi:MAG: hypothetical protein WCX47_03990 [Bacilli bacterium]|jgi:hypothetical protein|nr:hypothetical protein [Bacilli bacterium]MDD3389608.1 hypothetical protein [Bacilli bacterium]MDD4345193.1 hypothetical protein [Bacilli bacterium]MDD4521262.1 hypothetical protein [Bacilli bacterium]MDY0399888.1 hypothetical protein [Bacilli bacterium]